MLLTAYQARDILEIHYKSMLYKLHHQHFKTAKKYGRDWLIESWEVMEIREKGLKGKRRKKDCDNT